MRCVHCLKETGATKDHVFPSSWYPDNTDPKVQRPTVPSCAECNNSLGAVEKRLFQKLVMCVDPSKAGASGIHKRLYASLGVGIDRSELTPKEAKTRMDTLLKLIRPAQRWHSGIKAFPGLGLHEGFKPEDHRVIPVPHDELIRVSEKIVKGLEYKLGNRYVEKPFKLEVYFVENPEVIQNVQDILQKYGAAGAYGPGFLVQRAEATDGPHPSMLYRIRIWETLSIYSSVTVPIPGDED